MRAFELMFYLLLIISKVIKFEKRIKMIVLIEIIDFIIEYVDNNYSINSFYKSIKSIYNFY